MASAYEEALMALIAASSGPRTNSGTTQSYQTVYINGQPEYLPVSNTSSTTSMMDKAYADQLLGMLEAARNEEIANDPLAPMMSQVQGEYDKGQTKLNTGIAKLGEATAGYQARQADIMSLLNGQGAQQAADITSRFNQQKAQTDQDLMSRGLGNSTVRSSAMQGLTSAESAEQRRLGETLTNQKVDAMTGLSGDYLRSLMDAGKSYLDVGSRYPSLIDVANVALNFGKAANDRSSIPVRSLLG